MKRCSICTIQTLGLLWVDLICTTAHFSIRAQILAVQLSFCGDTVSPDCGFDENMQVYTEARPWPSHLFCKLLFSSLLSL